MNMIGHKTVSVDLHLILSRILADELDVLLPVGRILKYVLPVITSLSNVMNNTFEYNPSSPRHHHHL